MNDFERFLNKINPQENGCWLWTGSLDKGGYGRFAFRGSNHKASRVAYMLWIGTIPEGYQVDHVKNRGCTSRACVSPDHLEAVTQKINMDRGNTNQNKGKTHCKYGHEFTEDNTKTYVVAGSTKRKCIACEGHYPSQVGERKNAYMRAYKANRKGDGSN